MRSIRRGVSEDAELWNRVKKTVTPIHKDSTIVLNTAGNDQRVVKAPQSSASQSGTSKKSSNQTARPPLSTIGRGPATPKTIERPLKRKLSKGKVSIEAKLDLHDMTQHEAHQRLTEFLFNAHHKGLRYVLIITGKGNGNGGQGILRRMVPYWLSLPPLANWVSASELSARHHGGDGALYVRLTKNRG